MASAEDWAPVLPSELSSEFEVLEDASAFEQIAVPLRVEKVIDKDDLETLWNLNKHWIYMEPTEARIDTDTYIQKHDPALRPFLQEFFASLNCKMIRFEEFKAEFTDVAVQCLEWLDSFVDPSQPVYLWGGESFAKSNTWLIIMFWDIYRRKFGPDHRFNFFLIAEHSIVPPRQPRDILIHVDDCSYSGD